MASTRVFHRISDKVRNKLAPYVWIHREYQPVGVIKLADMNGHGMDYIEINPPYTSVLSLDQKFLDDCAPNLRPKVSVQYPGDYVVTLKSGRIYMTDDANMAVITSDNYLVEELSFQWIRGKSMLTGTENSIFRNRIFSRPRKYEGKVFSLLSGGGAIHYYYHWLFDSLPRLALLQASGLFSEVDYFLVPSTEHKFHRDYLEYFGIPESKILSARNLRHLQAETLIVSSYTRVEEHLPKWICDFLYNRLTLPGAPNKQDRLIYIGRGDALRNRRVLNEPALIKALLKLGFEVHFLAGLSIEDQVKLFNSAKMVVASHGGGLSNLVYSQPGTQVLEFFPDNYVNHLFYDLCTKRGLKYNYLICKSSTNYGEDELQAETNTIADIEAIEKEVRRMLDMPEAGNNLS